MGGHGHGHGGGGHHGGHHRGGHGGGGWWDGAAVVYVNAIDQCPPGFEANVHPDGTVVCTRIQAAGVADLNDPMTVSRRRGGAGCAGGPGVGTRYDDAAGPYGRRSRYGVGEVPAGPVALLENPLVVFAGGVLVGYFVGKGPRRR